MADEAKFNPAQCRAARALVGWTQADLATDSSIGVMTVKRFEAGKDVRPAQAAAMRRSLTDRGVLFLDDPSICNGRTVSNGVAMIASSQDDQR